MLSSFEKNANFHALDLGFFAQNRPSYQERTIMITGLKKKQKTTEIYFNEADDITTISTYNTKLKNRLLEFSKECPELCKLISDDELGCLVFEINKDSFTFRCMKPPSDKKREKARRQMNKLIGKTTEVSATISEPKPNVKKTLWEQKYGKN